MTTKRKTLEQIRTAFADYVRSEGCSCCRDGDAHEEAMYRMAKLLDIPPYSDGSGYDTYQFTTEAMRDVKKQEVKA